MKVEGIPEVIASLPVDSQVTDFLQIGTTNFYSFDVLAGQTLAVAVVAPSIGLDTTVCKFT